MRVAVLAAVGAEEDVGTPGAATKDSDVSLHGTFSTNTISSELLPDASPVLVDSRGHEGRGAVVGASVAGLEVGGVVADVAVGVILVAVDLTPVRVLGVLGVAASANEVDELEGVRPGSAGAAGVAEGRWVRHLSSDGIAGKVPADQGQESVGHDPALVLGVVEQARDVLAVVVSPARGSNGRGGDGKASRGQRGRQWVRDAAKHRAVDAGDVARSRSPDERREADVRRDVARAVGAVVVVRLDLAARRAVDLVAGEVVRAVGVAAGAGLAEERRAGVERATRRGRGEHQATVAR